MAILLSKGLKLDIGTIAKLLNAPPEQLLWRQARLLGPQPQRGGSFIG